MTSQIQQEVNEMLGFRAAHNDSYSAARKFAKKCGADLASPDSVKKTIEENIIEARTEVPMLMKAAKNAAKAKKKTLSASTVPEPEPMAETTLELATVVETSEVEATKPIEIALEGLVPSTTPETVPEPIQQDSTGVQVSKAGIKGVEAKRFNVKMPDNNYKAVYLEPEFITALGVIAPENLTKFFKAAVSNIGERNPAGAIRGAIVIALLARLNEK